MAVYSIKRYPRQSEMRDGACVTLRPMTRGDEAPLLEFFKRVPEEERFLLKDDVTSPTVVHGWAEYLDYDRALPLLAVAGDRIVADAVLVRHRGGYRSHSSEVRVVVDPEWRGRGLGLALMRELAEIAYDAELDQVTFEMVADVQDEMIRAAESLGAVTAGRVTDFAKDIRGHHHDVVYLTLPLGKWWEWSQF